MRHTLYILLVLTGMAYLFSACSKMEEAAPSEDTFGTLALDLATVQPNRLTLTKATTVDVNAFSVTIKQGKNVVKSFDTFQKLKESGTLRLEKGAYTIIASQAGQMAEVSEQPFYLGQKVVNVEANAFVKPTIDCLMQQVRIKVKLEKELRDALTALPTDLSISNGNGSYTFKIDSNTGESDEIYIKPTEEFRLSFSATEKEYQEPISYSELLKYSGGKSPVANDYVTVTIGLATDGTKAFSPRSANRSLIIKMTVQ